MEVVVQNDNIEKAIIDLKRKAQRSGLFMELRRSSFFATKSQRRKLKDRIALRRLNKAMKRRLYSEGRR